MFIVCRGGKLAQPEGPTRKWFNWQGPLVLWNIMQQCKKAAVELERDSGCSVKLQRQIAEK